MKSALRWIVWIGAVATPAFAGSQNVSRSEFGDSWPLSVEDGVLACEAAGAVTFTTNGVTYAVNGLAKSNKAFANIDRIWMGRRG